MKLIPLTILLTSLAVDVNAQKFRQEYSFPPQFQTPNVGLFSSDSSLYLPPESHTALPYFPMKNVNNLQYPLLPPTGTKAPSMFPSPFPFIMSTTLVPNFDDDDDDEDNGRIRLSSSPPPMPQRKNHTERAPEPVKEKREMRPIPKNMYPPPIPIQNRNDIKFPFNLPTPGPQPATQPPPPTSTPATRRMIISAETQRSDVDQVKAPSFLQGLQGPQFLPAGQGIYVSSSTEPAIPILRLSNEMDLDGSFSYEALGADQTHYVQHSRMENMGTDKEEQVVEGSYSYVGDNGHTYTVHYVADANGFRASGDHLPVAPPVPEIIQRAVQYNLAEEAKKPPHLKSWQDDGRDNEIRDSEKTQQFSLPPTRNLFTGRTPEAFSYSYSQGSNTGNNLVTAASNQAPVKTVDYSTEPPKLNNGPISPQITFLASQGAHLPSLNSVQNTISRMFATDKPPLPQIVNYEAQIKDAEQEPNKGLWRWQYGINANNLNQNPNKDTISRSSGEGDDVIINFSDMTPDQYTKMIQSQLEYNPDNVSNQYTQNSPNGDNFNNHHANSVQTHNSEVQQYRNLENERSASSQNYYFQNNESDKNYRNSQNLNYNQNQQNSQMADSSNSKDFDNRYNSPSPAQNPNQNNYVPNFYQYHESSTVQQSEGVVHKQYPAKSDYNEHLPSVAQTSHLSVEWTTSQPTESRKLNSERSKILTHKDFTFPTETVTQSYDFEDTFYEPRKIKALVNVAENSKPTTNSANQVQNIFEKGVSSDSPWDQNAFEVQQSTTPEPYISTIRDFKFSDFIVQESKNDFKPVVTTTTTEATRLETTTENILEDILQNNVFLKNLFSPNKSEKVEQQSSIRNFHEEKKVLDEPKKLLHTKVEAEPKTDKVTKLVQYQPKPINDIKLIKKKPLDIAELLNYVSMKSNFESSKVKPKGRINNFDQNNDVRFIPIQHERDENEMNVPDLKNNVRTMHKGHPEELRGQIKNYKVLQRNNNSLKYDNSPLKTELSPPPLKSPSLPPLGRAGPSMKSYLPPIYV